MRKRIKGELVCCGDPKGNITNMDARELDETVKWGMKAVECSHGGDERAKRGLHLGKICEDAGHPVLALRVWTDTFSMVSGDNWEWCDEPINTAVYSFDSKVASTTLEELARNIDRLWRKLGHDEQARYMKKAKDDYRSLWLWKYQEPYWE